MIGYERINEKKPMTEYERINEMNSILDNGEMRNDKLEDDAKEPPDTSLAVEIYVGGKKMSKNELIVENNFSNSHIGNVKVINDNSVIHNHYHSSTEQRSISSISSISSSLPGFTLSPNIYAITNTIATVMVDESSTEPHINLNHLVICVISSLVVILAVFGSFTLKINRMRHKNDIWKTCKEASRNNNPSLLTEAFDRYNLTVNSVYYIGDRSTSTESLLHYAVLEGDIDVVQFLLAMNNVDVNKANGRGYTVLMLACRYNRISVVRLLLNVVDIDVNKADGYGNTALMFAVFYNKINVVGLLLNVVDIDVNKTNGKGFTALMWASCYNRRDIVRVLLNVVDIDVNKIDSNGRTALMLAARCNNKGFFVRLLLKMVDNDGDKIHSQGSAAMRWQAMKVIALFFKHSGKTREKSEKN